MAIRKFTDITNETSTKYDRYKNTQIKATIENVFDTGSASNSPNDAAIQFLKEKIDDIIEETNVQTVASSSLETKIKSITPFPGFGTSNSTALRGDTTTISTSQTNAITANTAKTGITSGQASAITANTAKRDGRYSYHFIVANFNGNINTQQYVPLSDGETEGTSITGRRDNFVAPCTGTIEKVIVRSNASLYNRGKGVTLTGKLHNITDRNSTVRATGTATTTTTADNFKNVLDFSSVSGNSFVEGDRLLVSLQAPLDASKNYYVTVVFKLDLNSF